MNSEEAGLLWNRKLDIEQAGGEAAHRQHALKHLKLKTVIKLSFNYATDSMHNLFATVGNDQATVYDDLHMGDFVAVVVSFANQKTEHAEGGAVAGSDSNISLISIVEAQVVGLLQGHQKDVIDLAAYPCKPHLLVSLSKDGNIRIWDTEQEVCIVSYATDATCLAASPDGQYFVTGGRKGAITRYQIPAQQLQPTARDTNSSQAGNEAADKEKLDMECSSSGRHTETLDCIAFLSKDRLASKSSDGRMCVWSLPHKKQISTWKVPSCSAGSSMASRCQFGSTPDGAYICVGNTTGDIYVFDTADGKRMAHVAPIKVSAPVKACGISSDCRHLLAAVGNGFIFRFEYRKADAEVAAKENSDMNMLEDDE